MPEDQVPYRAPPRPGLLTRRRVVPVVAGFLGTIGVAAIVLLVGHASGGGGGGEGAVSGGGGGDVVLSQPVPVGVTASCARGPSQDSLGNPTSYEPTRAVDGDPTTAWRCAGDGVGQSLTVTFAGPARVSVVGLIPGLAKTDPGDGTDRYAQNRRISAVRISTDAWATTVQLDTSDADRGMQYARFADVITRSVTITILGSVPGSVQNNQAAVDTVAISEIRCGG